MIYWKDIIARFKLRLSYEDLRRISIEYANLSCELEPLVTALPSLGKLDDSKDHFWQWQLEISSSLKKIAKKKSRKEQALQCRIEIMRNIENTSLSDFLISFNDSEVRNYLIDLIYADERNLNKSECWVTLLHHYTFCLLTSSGLYGIYIQQYEKYISFNEFSEPYNVICRIYSKVLCYTSIFNELFANSNEAEVKSIASLYKDEISDNILIKLLEARADYESWIKAGHIDGIDTYRSRLFSLANKYSESLDSAKKEIDAL